MFLVALKPLYVSNPKKIMRRFSALLEEYEDMPKDQRMMVYMMWEELAKDDPQVRAPSRGLVVYLKTFTTRSKFYTFLFETCFTK